MNIKVKIGAWHLIIFVVLVFLGCNSSNQPPIKPGYEVYSNKNMGFSIHKPSDMDASKWDINDVVQGNIFKIKDGVTFLRQNSPITTDYESIAITIGEYKSVGDDLMDKIGILMDFPAFNMPRFFRYNEVIPPSKIKVNNHLALVMAYKMTAPMIGSKYTIRLALINDKNAFVIKYTSGLEHKEKIHKLFEDTIHTININ